MWFLPRRGVYDRPVAFDGEFHYPAGKEPGARVRVFRIGRTTIKRVGRHRSMARHRLVRVQPGFEERNGFVEEALARGVRNLDSGVIEHDELREAHDEHDGSDG